MPEVTNPQPQADTPAPPRAPVKKKSAQKKKMAKRLVALGVAAAILGGGGFGLYRFLNSGGANQGEIFAQPAYIGSIQSKVSGSGTAKAK